MKYMESQPQIQFQPNIINFDHCTLWVANAKQAASFYTVRFGFQYFAYKGLQTGQRLACTHVVKNTEGVTICLKSVYQGQCNTQMNEHLIRHGDQVKDIAFTVNNCVQIHSHAIKNGAKEVLKPTQLKDQDGYVIISTVKAFGDVTHTFVERLNYKGIFLPGFVYHPQKQPINKIMQKIVFQKIDHIAVNQVQGQMEKAVSFYQNCLNFHRFWSVDDNIIDTKNSALKTIIVADYNEVIKIPIAEPSNKAGRKKSQNQQFLDYNGGPGVQHIALNTNNIVKTIEDLKSRGLQFLRVPQVYYDKVRKNLPDMNIKISQQVDELQRNHILIDYDDKGYILQIFTKPIQDRPTLFFQVIQRRNHNGFGAGNIKNLFLAIEQEQKKRGNLI